MPRAFLLTAIYTCVYISIVYIDRAPAQRCRRQRRSRARERERDFSRRGSRPPVSFDARARHRSQLAGVSSHRVRQCAPKKHSVLHLLFLLPLLRTTCTTNEELGRVITGGQYNESELFSQSRECVGSSIYSARECSAV